MRYPELPLAGGEYDFVLFLADPVQGAFPIAFYDMWGPQAGHDTRVHVAGGDWAGEEGLVDLPATWSVEARGALV